VKVIDRGWKRIQKEFKKASDGEGVTVGVQGSEAQESSSEHGDLTNVQLGAIHEFGKGRVPERSHIRSSFDENLRKYEKLLWEVAREITEGDSFEGELLLLGEMARKDVIDKIKSSIPPPLKESTIRRKRGETTPLIDTGAYWNSISSKRKSGF
jgi:hypothetical protein